MRGAIVRPRAVGVAAVVVGLAGTLAVAPGVGEDQPLTVTAGATRVGTPWTRHIAPTSEDGLDEFATVPATEPAATAPSTPEPPPTVTPSTKAPSSPEPPPIYVVPTEAPVSSGDDIGVDQAGLWVLDLESRALRRVADAGPFDVAGDSILVAQGESVLAFPVAGGDPTVRYTLSPMVSGGLANGYWVDNSREKITHLEAGPDGSAVVVVSAPVVGPDGESNGYGSVCPIVGPDGTIVSPGFDSAEVEWTDDGAALAVFNWEGLRVLRPDGVVVSGPVPGADTLMGGLRWTADHSTLAGKGQGPHYFTLSANGGGWSPFDSVQYTLDFGPDGRVVGQYPVGEGGELGIIVGDPATGASTIIAPKGMDAGWSPDGRRIWVIENPIDGPWHERPSLPLRVVDDQGTVQLGVVATNGLSVQYGSPSPTPGWTSPQWAGGDRYLVFIAAASAVPPWPF